MNIIKFKLWEYASATCGCRSQPLSTCHMCRHFPSTILLLVHFFCFSLFSIPQPLSSVSIQRRSTCFWSLGIEYWSPQCSHFAQFCLIFNLLRDRDELNQNLFWFSYYFGLLLMHQYLCALLSWKMPNRSYL